MKFKHIWTVFKKEVKDISRDKRTLLISIVVPMVIIPLLNSFVGGGMEKLQKDINENVTVALSDKSNAPDIKNLVLNDIIADNKSIRLIDTPNASEALKQDKVRLILDIDKDFKSKIDSGKPFDISISYDKSRTKSEGSIWIVNDAISKFNKKILKERMNQLGKSEEFLEPARTKEINVADETKTSTSMLAMFLPIIIVILMTVGGVPAATDLMAGEKERNTLEPLLTTKPGRVSILLGKYFTVTLFSFITVIASVVGLIIGYILKPSSLNMGTGQHLTGFFIPLPALLISILLAIALGMTFAGIQVALSTYARSFKEAQVYLSFLMIAAMVPAYANFFTQPSDIPMYYFFIPIINTISAFKIVLGGSINYFYLIIAFVSSAIHVMIALGAAVYMFSKEKVLFRS
ncbi:MAG: ABC transporter permease [Bacillota bacterium]|nr:ABC transporter permease [Bacillota bacterium]